MRIATFNCNSVRTRLGAITRWITRNQPDVLALQETKVVDELFPHEVFSRLHYHACFRGMKSYNGVALLSRKKPTHTQFGVGGSDPQDAARLLHAKIDGIDFINTYVPQGRSIDHPAFAYKLEWLRQLRAYFNINLKPDQPAVWFGDLNVARTSLDVYNPEEREDHVCFHQSARAALQKCVDWGFVDAFREFHPEPGHYSFFSYRINTPKALGKGWRLDYIMASRHLAKRLRRCWIDLVPRREDRPSDHCVVVADFD